MKIDELEDLLSEKKNEVKAPAKPSSLDAIQEFFIDTSPFTGPSLLGENNYSEILRAQDMSDADKNNLFNTVIRYINTVYTKDFLKEYDIWHLEIKVETFVETYCYKWFRYLVRPVIKCPVVRKSDYYTMDVLINNFFVGKIGIATNNIGRFF